MGAADENVIDVSVQVFKQGGLARPLDRADVPYCEAYNACKRLAYTGHERRAVDELLRVRLPVDLGCVPLLEFW